MRRITAWKLVVVMALGVGCGEASAVTAPDGGAPVCDACVTSKPPPATCANTTCDTNASCDDASGTPVCACGSGYFGDASTCSACSSGCISGQYESMPCAGASDRQCAACAPIANCAVASTCTSGLDGQCATCAAGYFRRRGITDACSPCATCDTGKFVTAACTAESDTTCGSCSAGCNACGDAATCTACATGYTLVSGACSRPGLGRSFPLYVGTGTDKTIVKYDRAGSAMAPVPFATLPSSPDYGLGTVDVSTGELYVPLINKLVKEPSGAALATFSATVLQGSAGGADGNLYVSNFTGNKIHKITPAGVVTAFVSTGLSGPLGVAVDAAGNLYVASFNGGTVTAFGPTGAVLSTWGASGVVSGFTSPSGLAFFGATLFVAEQNAARVKRISADGMTTTTFATFASGQANGIAFDAAGDLYVADRTGGRVVKVDHATFVAGGAEPATGISTFITLAKATSVTFSAP